MACCGLCTCPQVHILILWRCHVAIQIVACGSCQMPTAVQHRQRGWDPLRRCVVLPRQCIWTLPPYLCCVAHHNTLNGLVPIFWVGGLGDLSRNINTNTFPVAGVHPHRHARPRHLHCLPPYAYMQVRIGALKAAGGNTVCRLLPFALGGMWGIVSPIPQALGQHNVVRSKVCVCGWRK
jgi:hypothetical protein